ncbi:MAG: 3-carboxy-cis,cis-muconate cycloisomerase [Bosea sp. (in: a-proteobacteria)]
MALQADLTSPFLRDPAFDAIMGSNGLVQRMIEFEVKLARVEARIGLIPPEAARLIEQTASPALIDMAVLAEAAAIAGNPAIPLVKMLMAGLPDDAARYLHWGATSQDAMDTALVMQLGEVIAQMLDRLRALGDILAGLAETHRATPLAARTLLQQALPTTFGAKAAGWLMPVMRHMQRLKALRPRLLVIQFGGAAGTRAALGGAGDLVSRSLAMELGLDPSPLPWHTARDSLSEFAAVCGLICGSLGKIAQDVALLMQTEIGEVLEGAAPGKGGSSTLPHKRNPVATHAMLAIARLSPGLVGTMMATQVQAHERAVGDWPAEWVVLPDLVSHTGAALNHALAMLPALEIRTEEMRANLDATKGLVMAESVMMALAQHIGRGAAQHVVELASRDAARQKRHLAEVLAADTAVTTYLDAGQLMTLTSPEAYLGDAIALADAGVALWGRHLAGAA